MYHSGERITTSRAVELTGRSRRHIGKRLQKLAEQGILNWYGNSKNDKNQYDILALK